MEVLKGLPPAARIGIPALLGLIVLAVVYFTLLNGPHWTTIEGPADADTIQAAKWKLDAEKTPNQVVKDANGQWSLQVMDTNDGGSLTGTNLTQRMEASKRKACVKPGQFASRALVDAAAACSDEDKIYRMLKGLAVVLQAQVSVVKQDSGELVGAENVSNVTVQLFLDPKAERPDGRVLAGQIANLVEGGSLDRVVISDSDGGTLWSKDMGASSAAGGSIGCMPGSESINDITTKEQAVKTCIEQDLLTKIAEVVGGAGRASVSVGVSLSPAAETRTAKDVTKAVLMEQNKISNSGGGASSLNDNKSFAPSTTETTRTTNAGYIQRMSISATLDSTYVTPAMESAVRNLLKAYVDTDRGDPMPYVLSTQFAKRSKKATPDGDGAKGAPDAAKADSTSALVAATAATQGGGIPGIVLVIGMLLLVGLLTMIALLWRRNTRLTSERARYDEEFRNDQRLFENFAQTNPDDLARELEGLFGPPATRTPAG